MTTHAFISTSNMILLQASALPADGVLIQAEWELVYDSPYQYRKTHNEAKLTELADNIKATGGIHQPILARRRFTNTLRKPYAWDPADGFEIVAGHRRKISGMRAELPSGPLLVKDLDDDQVRKIQITENLQREDVHAIEEAEGFQALIDLGDTPEGLAKDLGKSLSYVYARIKLLQACKQIRSTCLAGDIGVEVALLIARLRTDKLQEKALGYIKGKNIHLEDGGNKSLRQVRELLKERFTLGLSNAMFDPGDANLLPLAGACSACPKRTGNAPEYTDLVADRKAPWGQTLKGSANLCTDPDCFDAKKKAHLKAKAGELIAKGKTVVDGNKARNAIDASGRIKGDFIALKDVKDELKKANRNTLMGVPLEKAIVVTIQDPRDGKTHDAVAVADLVAAGIKFKEQAKKGNHHIDYEAERRKREEERLRDEAKAKAEGAVRAEILTKVIDAAKAAARSTFDLQMVAHVAFAGVDYHDRAVLAKLYGGGSRDDVHKQIGSMDPGQAALFALTCALVQDVYTHSGNYKNMPKTLTAAAKHYGLDIDAIRAGLEAPAKTAFTPPSAALAQKKATAGASAKKSATKAAPAKAKSKGKEKGEEQKVDAGVAGGSAGQVDAIEEAGA